MFVAAMNPCPCGFHGDERRHCRCSEPQIDRYAGRISGPLRDRIDLVVDVPAAGFCVQETSREEPSTSIRERVVAARAIQGARFEHCVSKLNSAMEGSLLRRHSALDDSGSRLMRTAIRKFCLSARGYDRVLRVGRTIADLAGSTQIKCEHIAEALQYRIRTG
jgi:magnesium chelatase family protein